MLNDWSDRDPDPPTRSGWPAVIAVIVLVGTVVFLFNLVATILGD